MKIINLHILNLAVTLLFSALGLTLIVMWFNVIPGQEIVLRTAPLQDNTAAALAVQKVNIKGTFVKLATVPVPTGPVPRWSGFRGNHHDNIVTPASGTPAPLLARLDPAKLPVVWSQKVGEGYAGAAIRHNRVYLLDYDKEKQSDTLRCFALETGQELWRRAYRIQVKRNHGMSRTVPAVGEKHVVTIGPKCQVLCADALTGEFKWGLDLPTQYGTDVPLWYTGQCPVIDGNLAVIAPAGSSLMIGVDLETGRIVWETPNPGKFKMSHASIIPMTFFGQRMYVYCAIGGMVGVAASGPKRGEILWQTGEWNQSVISPSPVQVSHNRIFVTAGYGGGSRMFRLSRQNGTYAISTLFKLDKEIFACEQHTPIFYRGYLYSILPNDAEEASRQLVCLTPGGKVKWRSGRNHRFGLGPFIIADQKIYILDDDGVLTIAKADARQYTQLSRTQVLHGREAWAPIAVAGTKMVLRDFEEMICLDLKR